MELDELPLVVPEPLVDPLPLADPELDEPVPESDELLFELPLSVDVLPDELLL